MTRCNAGFGPPVAVLLLQKALMRALVLSAIVIGGVGTLFFDISQMQSQARIQSNISQVAANLKAMLSDSAAWNNTVNISLDGTHNTNFACAARKTAGCAPTPVAADPLTYPNFAAAGGTSQIQDGSAAP